MTDRFDKILKHKERIILSLLISAIVLSAVILGFLVLQPFPKTLVITTTVTEYPSVYTLNNTYNSHPIDGGNVSPQGPISNSNFSKLCVDSVPQLELSYSNLPIDSTILFYLGISANVETMTPAIGAFNTGGTSEMNLPIGFKAISANITVGTILTLADWYMGTALYVQQITVTSCGE